MTQAPAPRVTHRRNVGRDGDRVGHEQQRGDRQHDSFRRMQAQFGRDATPRLAPDPRAHELDRDHERKREEHGPQHAGAELRARLRVGGNARWIVVGCARHHARADTAQERTNTQKLWPISPADFLHGRDANEPPQQACEPSVKIGRESCANRSRSRTRPKKKPRDAGLFSEAAGRALSAAGSCSENPVCAVACSRGARRTRLSSSLRGSCRRRR